MMFALEVELLTGRYVATNRNDRTAAEWPPHPARLFSALAAALFECDFGPQEHEALEWLERQDAPTTAASAPSRRTVVTSFVPANDSNEAYVKRGKKISIFAKIDEGIEVRRNRQERRFPTIVPEHPTVHFNWTEVAPDEVVRYRPALSRLAANVTYFGHSSSLVRVAVCDDAPAATYRPAEAGEPVDVILRVPAPGRLKALEEAYRRSIDTRVNRRIEPPEGRMRGYVHTDRPVKLAAVHGLFDDRLIVFRCRDGRQLPLHASLHLTATVRKALIDLADDPVPEVLCGHDATGNRSTRPHVAIVPLPYVGHRHADGTIMGFAIVLPRALSEQELHDERQAVLRAIGRLEKLTLGRAGEWWLERLSAESHYKTLQPARYTRPSRRWATLTPVVFGRFPKSCSGRRWTESPQVTEMVREHCRMIDLPEPVRVQVADISPILGVPPSPHFPTLTTSGKPIGKYPEKGRSRLPKAGPGQGAPRLRAHVVLEFDDSVCGPLLLGAGRYLGLGFCMPIFDKSR